MHQATVDALGHDRLASVLPEPDAEYWYANLVWIERRTCLVLTHLRDVVQCLQPRRPCRGAAYDRSAFRPLAATALADDGLRGDCDGDLASICEHAAIDAGGLARLDGAQLNQNLHRIIHRARDYEPPIEAAREQLGSD